MLLYMPWCRIDDSYDVGDIVVLPFEPAQQPTGVNCATWSRICTIMAAHKDINGNPVDRAALVQFKGKALMDDLSSDEIDAAGDLIGVACFAGLASREFFRSLARYCNSDCFTFYLQKADGTGSTAINTRRRDGRSLSVWAFSKVAVSVPVHCHNIKVVALDRDLMKALVAHRAAVPDDEWGRWQNAIACFNQANTDSDSIRHHVEWVLLCSAFEHLLGARSDYNDVARLFEAAVVPVAVVEARTAARHSSRFSSDATSLRYEWMRELYRVRGDFAHGRLVSAQPMAWQPHEHLMLATIAFPLVVKSLLVNAGRYSLTEEDHAQIDCFEALANTPDFFSPPPDAKSSWDSAWERLLCERLSEMASEEFRKGCLVQPGPIEGAADSGNGEDR